METWMWHWSGKWVQYDANLGVGQYAKVINGLCIVYSTVRYGKTTGSGHNHPSILLAAFCPDSLSQRILWRFRQENQTLVLATNQDRMYSLVGHGWSFHHVQFLATNDKCIYFSLVPAIRTWIKNSIVLPHSAWKYFIMFVWDIQWRWVIICVFSGPTQMVTHTKDHEIELTTWWSSWWPRHKG